MVTRTNNTNQNIDYRLPEFVSVGVVQLACLTLLPFLPVAHVSIAVRVCKISDTICEIILPLTLKK